MRPLFFALFSIILLQSALNSGCRKDPLDDDPDARLLFSKDTVVFDTVFTTVGSATRQFKVYNTSSKAVNISSIRLAGGSASPFRINVDGVPLVSTGDILLRGGDSIFVFVDVTVNPNNSNSPLMISDSVLFETNGNLQRVILNAVGQDAYFHYNTYLTCNEIWTNDKPHVIYGYAVVPQCCKLTIQAGARVHLHKNAVLAADSCATLEVLGAQNNPVVFQGDRLEPDYAEEPGQWGYIWLSSLSKDNIIDWAVIKNGTVGILSDSLGASANPTVKITNTKIRNMTLAGIYGRDTHIEGNNITVENCAQYCAILAYGGKYSFIHCTFGNYWSIDNRSTPAVVLNNWYKVTETLINRRNLEQADFINCIIYGDKDNELALDSNVTTGILFNYKFENCLIRTDLNTSAQPARFLSNVYNQNPQFINPSGYNLHILATSPAHNLGNTSVSASVPLDLDGVLRLSDGQSDAGAYEAN
ncbi:MAG: hypothetical protein Fur0041_19190 [Bacteroidia bacterium]